MQQKDKFVLKDKDYEVISIDFRQEKVIIRRTSDDKEIEIRKFPAGDKKPDKTAGGTATGGRDMLENKQGEPEQ